MRYTMLIWGDESTVKSPALVDEVETWWEKWHAAGKVVRGVRRPRRSGGGGGHLAGRRRRVHGRGTPDRRLARACFTGLVEASCERRAGAVAAGHVMAPARR